MCFGKKERSTLKISKNRISSSIIVVIILMTLVISIGSIYISYMKGRYDTIQKKEINRETDQVVKNIKKQIADNFYYLKYFSKNISDTSELKCDSEVNKIKSIMTGEKFYLIGMADKDGNACDINGDKYDISSEEYFVNSMNNEYVITNTIIDGNKKYNIYSIPIKHEEDVVGVLYAKKYTGEIEYGINEDDMEIEKDIWVVDHDGTIIFDTTGEDMPENENKKVRTHNFIDKIEELDNSTRTIAKLSKAVSSNEPAFMRIKYHKAKIAYVKPMDVNDWKIITIISHDKFNKYMAQSLDRFNQLVYIFAVIYGATLLVVLVIQNKNRKKIEHIAYVDEVTGGKSFTKFKDDVDKLIKSTSDEYALVDLDVDKFKYINDIFGYEEGNNVIRFIWREINNIMETGEVFAHYRADQFVLLLKANDMDHVIKRMEMLSLTAQKRGVQKEKNYEIILSIGIYPVDRKFFNIDTAIDRADLTKKSIKGKHSKVYAIYDDTLRQKELRDQEIENMMEKAIKDEEFKVYYQPKYNSSNGELTGSEALVRWYNEECGMLFPNEFIPVFENNGFIVELDEYMFEHVCMDIRKWLDSGYNVVPVSVNMSQLQLYNSRFIEEYTAILKKYNVPAEYIQLEMTETTLFSETDALIDTIDKLHKAGIKILMDDFGTGYSSLNMLKSIPVDILKLDKSFVDDIGESKGDIVVSTIVSLGQLLDMKIVAEGVETKEQYEFLRDIFCDEIQGYYFSRPISSEEYIKKMTKGAL